MHREEAARRLCSSVPSVHPLRLCASVVNHQPQAMHGFAVSGRERAEGHTREDVTVTLKLKDRGPWLVKTLHIMAAGDAAYRSWWSSLTFER
jgi:hypothetical protein